MQTLEQKRRKFHKKLIVEFNEPLKPDSKRGHFKKVKKDVEN